MAQQEEGWPLGLQPLHERVGLPRNNAGGDNSGSVSFNTLITGSPTSSTDFSSDLDTESTGSFFHDKSITLGSLIGVSSIFELSKRSIRGRKAEAMPVRKKNNSSSKSRTWLFSLCSRDTTDAENINNNNPPSLGHFLAVERRDATNGCRTNQSPNIYGPEDEIAMAQPNLASNSLFVNGQVAPPQARPWHDCDVERGNNGVLEHKYGNENGCPVLFSWMCGQSAR